MAACPYRAGAPSAEPAIEHASGTALILIMAGFGSGPRLRFFRLPF